MTFTENPDQPSIMSPEEAEREKELRAKANLLYKSGDPEKQQEAIKLFAEADAIVKKYRTSERKWEDRYEILGVTNFTPPLVDDEKDIGVTSVALATWEKLLNDEVVRVIRAIRFGIQVLSKDDARVPEIGKNGLWWEDEIIDPSISYTKKGKSLFNDLKRFASSLNYHCKKEFPDEREDAPCTVLEKMFISTSPNPYGDISLRGLSGEAYKVNIDNVLKGLPNQEDISNILVAIRAKLFNPDHIPHKVGSVRGGENRFKR